jgi:hypothetical protein
LEDIAHVYDKEDIAHVYDKEDIAHVYDKANAYETCVMLAKVLQVPFFSSPIVSSTISSLENKI